jgi:hypothetical protein
MSRLREQDFIEISITYMNNNEFKHICKIHDTGTPSNSGQI